MLSHPFRISFFISAKPTVELSQTRQFVNGDMLILRCEVVKGNPMNYTFEWEFMNTTASGKVTKQTSYSTLTIENFIEDNSGTYNCSATNEVGTGEDSIRVDYEGN